MKIFKKLELKGHSGAIYSIDGFTNTIFTGSGDKFCAKWNLETGLQEHFSLKADDSIYKIKLLSDYTMLIIGSNSGAMHIIDLVQKKEIKHFVQHKSAIFELTVNEVKKTLLSTDSDGNLAIWNTLNWDLELFLPLQVGKIRQLLFDQNQEKFYLACQTGKIKIFESNYYNEIGSFSAHKLGVNCLAFHPKKQAILFSGGKDGYLRIWDLEQNRLLSEIPAHNYGIYKICFFNNGESFVTISRDKSIKLWDTEKLKVIQKIERKTGGHSHSVNDLLKLTENSFVTVGDDKRIIHWELEFDS